MKKKKSEVEIDPELATEDDIEGCKGVCVNDNCCCCKNPVCLRRQSFRRGLNDICLTVGPVVII